MNAFSGWRPFGNRFNGGDSGNNGNNGNTSNNNNNNGGNNNNSTGTNVQGRDNNTRNNNENNIDLPENLWENEAQGQRGNNENNGNQNNGNNGNNGNQNTGGQPSAFDNYVASLDFSTQITPEMQQQFANGDFSSMNELMNSAGRQVFSRALQDMNRLMDAKVQKAVETATQQANATYRTNDFVTRMEGRLEYTKDPNIAPVARSVLAQFVRKGDDIDMAIKKVDAFFKRTANLANGGSSNRQGAPGSNGFRGQTEFPGGNGRGSQSQDEDWVAYMTQGA